jgi:DNA-binding CsgD family transcriptional regulator
MNGFLEAVQEGGGSLLLLGEPGVGKTVLLDVAAETASSLGMNVLRASGTEFEANVTFAGLHQALLPLRDLFTVGPDSAGAVLDVALGFAAGPAPDRLVVTNATLDVLRLAARSRPTLVAVDDLQWLDPASASVLALAARRIGGDRVGFLGAIRSGGDDFFQHSGLRELVIPPLERGAAIELLERAFPTMTPSLRFGILSEAQGNPLALLELPRLSTGRPFAVSSETGVTAEGRPHALFDSRIRGLPARTREILLLASLDGSGDLGVLQRASTTASGVADLEPAEKVGLVSVEVASRRLKFRHPLIRTAVVTLSTNEERRQAHRALAAGLANDAEQRAWHLAEATVDTDETVASMLEDAAHRKLRRGDTVGAVVALTRSSELSPLDVARGRRLAEAAFIGSNVTGTLADASSLLVAARRTALEGTGSLFAATAASFIMVNGNGDVDAAYRLLVRAIETERANPDVDRVALEEALHMLGFLAYMGASGEWWSPFYESLSSFPGPLPETLYLTGTVFADPCWASAEALGRLDQSIADLGEDDSILGMRIANLCPFVDRLPQCRDFLWRVVDEGRGGDSMALAIRALALLGVDYQLVGRWDEAEAITAECIELARVHGHELQSLFPRQSQAMLAAYRGDTATVERMANEMMLWATPRRARAIHTFWHMALHSAARGRGDFEIAYQHATAITPPGELPHFISTAVFTLLGFVESAVRTGRQAEAVAHVQAMRDGNLASISSRLALVVAGAEAMVAHREEATRLFTRALALPGAEEWVYDFACVELSFGEHLRRSRAIREARVHLQAAAEVFTQLKAEPWLRRAMTELRATRLGGGRIVDQGRGEMLTRQELEVASLAARGLTNKQIGERLGMSPRTVGTHLYRSFPKLGITSRAALRDALTALDPKMDPART